MRIPTPSLSVPLPAGLRLPPLAILRIVQCLLALLTLSLASAVAAAHNNETSTISSPREINFLIFTSLFTLLLILPYTTLTPRYFPRLANAYLMLSAEATSTLFYLAAFASTAHLISQHRSSSSTTFPAASPAIAATIFAAFLFTTFAATTSFAVQHLLTSPPPSPKYKRTHYHAHSRDLSSSLALEKQHAHERFHARAFAGSRSCTRSHSDDLPIAYPAPNLKILPRRGHDLEVAQPQNPFVTPPPRRQAVEKSSWSPDSCAEGFFPSSPSSFRRSPRKGEVEQRPYSTKLLVGKVRQGVGEIRTGASVVGGRLKAKMPNHVTHSWFGRERERGIPESEKGWRRVHEAGDGRRSWRAEMQG